MTLVPYPIICFYPRVYLGEPPGRLHHPCGEGDADKLEEVVKLFKEWLFKEVFFDSDVTGIYIVILVHIDYDILRCRQYRFRMKLHHAE